MIYLLRVGTPADLFLTYMLRGHFQKISVIMGHDAIFELAIFNNIISLNLWTMHVAHAVCNVDANFYLVWKCPLGSCVTLS